MRRRAISKRPQHRHGVLELRIAVPTESSAYEFTGAQASLITNRDTRHRVLGSFDVGQDALRGASFVGQVQGISNHLMMAVVRPAHWLSFRESDMRVLQAARRAF